MGNALEKLLRYFLPSFFLKKKLGTFVKYLNRFRFRVNMKKIVIIRGKSGAGKTTISYELAKVLPDFAFVDIWKIKEMFEPLNLKDRRHNQVAKSATYHIMREAIKKIGAINFVIQESRQSTVKKYLKNYLKKDNYKIYSFFLDVDLESALKRNVEREKSTMVKKHFIEQAKEGLKNKDKEDILIGTSNKSIKQVIDFILKEIGEKRKNHSGKNKIRKGV